MTDISTISMPAEMREEARKRGINISAWVRDRLAQELEQLKPPKALRQACPFCRYEGLEKEFIDAAPEAVKLPGFDQPIFVIKTLCPNSKCNAQRFYRPWTRKNEADSPLRVALYIYIGYRESVESEAKEKARVQEAIEVARLKEAVDVANRLEEERIAWGVRWRSATTGEEKALLREEAIQKGWIADAQAQP